ncbi:flagellar protein FliS [Catonella morbi ATCC 51271]|jgi:flagellar protein fliS|uniref:Flagellar protein FliS n=2 Tax=Catonella TaxID=43996 RepID=V2XXZ8_9FIRM|nr:flagellar protein FliS [Catonella morbi ATCC 51271]
MSMTNAASLYQGAAINTASPAELTLMLYNGAIKFCNLALIGMEEEDIMKAHNNLMKAQRIIRELQATLNFKYEVSKDFDLIYTRILNSLLAANIKKDTDKLNEALEDIRGIRDVWTQVMKVAKIA